MYLSPDERSDANHRVASYAPLTERQALYIRERYNEIGKNKKTGCHYPPGVSLRAGDDLLPPYSLEEVVAFEKKIGRRLPAGFRTYLLYVSRETCHAMYRTFINLTAEVEGDHDGRLQRMSVEDIIAEDRDFSDVYNGTLLIGQDGCIFDHHMVVRGDYEGLVFEDNDDDSRWNTVLHVEFCRF